MENKSWKYNNLLKLFEEKAHTVRIGGLSIKDQTVLNPTKEWLVKYYTIFNRKYFDSRLSHLESDDFEISANNREPAYTDQIVSGRGSSIESFQRPLICFSRYYQRTEKECCEILLHEMIHIYVNEIVKIIERGHGPQFINKLNEINSYGWSVPVMRISYNRRPFRSIKKLQLESYLMATQNGDNTYAVIVVPFNRISGLRRIPGCRLFKIQDEKEFVEIPLVDDIGSFFRDLQDRAIIMTIKTEEELNKYVEDGKLIEVSSDGVLLESKNNEENLLDELYGNTKEVLPNGLVVYHIRHVDYF